MDNETEEILGEHACDIDVDAELKEAGEDHGMLEGDVNTVEGAGKDEGHDGRHRYGKLKEHRHEKH
ncbi:hypothetical protein [Caniella muris]|uniref:hypothetical protein n=1 Tax=Caniella muris TaxID=2941502 RepID=UPI0020404D74|nr:hypothetical protein [Caniella muris]